VLIAAADDERLAIPTIDTSMSLSAALSGFQGDELIGRPLAALVAAKHATRFERLSQPPRRWSAGAGRALRSRGRPARPAGSRSTPADRPDATAHRPPRHDARSCPPAMAMALECRTHRRKLRDAVDNIK